MAYVERKAELAASENAFKREVEKFGLPFEKEESQFRRLRSEAASSAGARCENGGASLVRGWLSPACVACRKGERSATFFISLQCTRSCYFCFNPNQEDYAYHCLHCRDIAEELRRAHREGKEFAYLAVTGGEPCLHPEELCAFVAVAKDLYSNAHVRIYTSGDRLTDDLMDELSCLGLDEIRFSVKPEESPEALEELLGLIRRAVACFPAVMVEMPVIPGSLEDMKALLASLDAIGVKGINLLEFCFPLHNGEEFGRRGFCLRARPYEILYNYWYAGGLAVAGSEAEALQLLRFAHDGQLKLGVHYCSLDNKHTGQIYQQNKILLREPVAQMFPWLSLERDGYFARCAKVFDDDVWRVREILYALRESSAIEVSGSNDVSGWCYLNEAADMLSFPLRWAEMVHQRDGSIEIAESFNVLEPTDDGIAVREVELRRFRVNCGL